VALCVGERGGGKRREKEEKERKEREWVGGKEGAVLRERARVHVCERASEIEERREGVGMRKGDRERKSERRVRERE